MATESGKIALPVLDHLGVVVEDIDKAKQFFSQVFGLGPWQVINYAPTRDELLIGEPFRIRIAVARQESLVVELVQPIEGKSIWGDFLESKGEGLQHIAFTVLNWDETVQIMKQVGTRMVAGGIINSKRWCYFETNPGGLVVEYEEK